MRAAGAQQQAMGRKTSAALAKKGISQSDVNKAQNVKNTSIVDVVVKAGGDFLKGLLGITDMENCFGHGSVGSCVSLLLNVLPIGKIFEEGVNLARFVIRAIDAVRDFFRAAKEADRVLKDVAETTQAVEESFNAASEVNSVSESTAAADARTTDSGGGGGSDLLVAGGPRVRPGRDIAVDSNGLVHPPSGENLANKNVQGLSTYETVDQIKAEGLTGQVRKPSESLPEGLGQIADGAGVGGPAPMGHHTIYPTRSMPFEDFEGLIKGMNWQNIGVNLRRP